MTKAEAIFLLKGMKHKVMPAEVEALDMAIEALSNTPNTFNTLEALGITDKQINMAIGAIRYMLNNGYQSEDMEDALHSAIKVLAEAERGEGMMFFKDRKGLADKAEQWMEENHVAKTPLSVISYLEAMGWLKLDNNSTKVGNKNDELSCSEKPNRSDDYVTIKRRFVLDAVNIGLSGYISDDDKLTLEGMGIAVSEMPTTDLSGYSDRLWKSAYDRGYERCKQDAIEAVDVKCLHRGIVKGIQGIIEDLPSAQPDNRLTEIAELVEGAIDHFNLEDAMDLLYQIKEVLKNG